MREKGEYGKVKKILIRVDRGEKILAERRAKKRNMNVSEYVRALVVEDGIRPSLEETAKNVDKASKILLEQIRGLAK